MLTPTPNLPPPIPTSPDNAFGHDTMKRRVPEVYAKTQQQNPDWPESIKEGVAALAEEIKTDQPIRMLDRTAPDYETWQQALEQHGHPTWLQTNWFFAETFAYRHLIDLVRWWEFRLDPFTPTKEEEYGQQRLWDLMRQALSVTGSQEERLSTLLDLTLWGNRIDLSFSASLAHGIDNSHDDLLIDDTAPAVDALLNGSGDVHFIIDNAGTELAMDCMLADALLDGVAERVILHVKMHPTFVSDAIPQDVIDQIDRMQHGNHGETIAAAGARMRKALHQGRLRLIPDFYWNSPLFLWQMPERLIPVFESARLVLLKGDANYRRAVGDAFWPADTPFQDVMGYFPAPLVAVRTLKSDPIAGLAPGQADQLDQIDDQWRVNGKRGVIQFSRPAT